MHENVLPSEALDLISRISSVAQAFYLAGGTALALQLGHRVSIALDFFSTSPFDEEVLRKNINPEQAIMVRRGTLHVIKEGVNLSFLHYEVPLCYPVLRWRKINIASWKDIIAEKLKSISQRGAKKDFFDLYAVLKLKAQVSEVCSFFLRRFEDSGINLYHVLRSVVYFEDAEEEPPPVLLMEGDEWGWERVKRFFEERVRDFEKGLMAG